MLTQRQKLFIEFSLTQVELLCFGDMEHKEFAIYDAVTGVDCVDILKKGGVRFFCDEISTMVNRLTGPLAMAQMPRDEYVELTSQFIRGDIGPQRQKLMANRFADWVLNPVSRLLPMGIDTRVQLTPMAGNKFAVTSPTHDAMRTLAQRGGDITQKEARTIMLSAFAADQSIAAEVEQFVAHGKTAILFGAAHFRGPYTSQHTDLGTYLRKNRKTVVINVGTPAQTADDAIRQTTYELLNFLPPSHSPSATIYVGKDVKEAEDIVIHDEPLRKKFIDYARAKNIDLGLGD